MRSVAALLSCRCYFQGARRGQPIVCSTNAPVRQLFFFAIYLWLYGNCAIATSGILVNCCFAPHCPVGIEFFLKYFTQCHKTDTHYAVETFGSVRESCRQWSQCRLIGPTHLVICCLHICPKLRYLIQLILSQSECFSEIRCCNKKTDIGVSMCTFPAGSDSSESRRYGSGGKLEVC